METEGLLVRSIYYGRIGSKVTEKLLEMFGHDGSFLLRDSETVPGTFCLCVRRPFGLKDLIAKDKFSTYQWKYSKSRKAPFVHTYRLERDGGGWYIQDLRGRLLRFGSLESLIEHYRSLPVSNLGTAPLTHPLDKTTVPSNWIQGLVYMEVTGSSSLSGQ